MKTTIFYLSILLTGLLFIITAVFAQKSFYDFQVIHYYYKDCVWEESPSVSQKGL